MSEPLSTPPPPPAPPVAPPPRKMGVLGWLLVGCLALGLVGLGSCVACGMFFKKKVDAVRDNPARAAAEVLVLGNPNIEIVASDDEAKTVTLRDRRSGETMTVDLQQIGQGNIFVTDGDEDVRIDLGGDGIRIQSEDGRRVSIDLGADGVRVYSDDGQGGGAEVSAGAGGVEVRQRGQETADPQP